MGDFPWMTDRGTFIINGTERVVVTQLVRSPGAYVMEPKDPEKQVFIANLMPARGSWLELEIDKKGKVFVRIDRKRKLPVTVLLRAMGYARPTRRSSRFRRLALHPQHDRRRHRGHRRPRRARSSSCSRSSARASRRQRRQRAQPAEPAVLRPQALRPHARRPLQAQLAPGPRRVASSTRMLTHDDIIALIKELVSLPQLLGMPEPASSRTASRSRTTRPRRSAPARADRRPPRRVRALRQPPPAHRRRADPGGLPGRPVPHGARRPRAPHHRGRRHDHAADDHQHPPGRGGAEGVLRLLAAVAVHGPDELAGRPAGTAAACRRSAPAA